MYNIYLLTANELKYVMDLCESASSQLAERIKNKTKEEDGAWDIENISVQDANTIDDLLENVKQNKFVTGIRDKFIL